MNNSSSSSTMPPAFYRSRFAEPKEPAKPQVMEKKPAPPSPAAGTNDNGGDKLESKKSMDINESAELFIKKFRKQLLIQRLESIENYEEMLARGL